MPEVSAPEPLPVAQARAGEPAAWDALFRRYQLPLYVFVCELVHDEQASLDLVQETFIAAARHLAGLRDDEKFGSWLFGIAHQKCIQRWRKRTEVLLDELPENPDDSDDGPGRIAHPPRTGGRVYESAVSNCRRRSAPCCCCILSRIFARRNRANYRARNWARSNRGCITAKKPCANYWRPAMRTPREILLARHRAAEPKLDAIRQAAVAATDDRRPPAQAWSGLTSAGWQLVMALWRELILPSRRIWTGLAAVWIILIIVNVSSRDTDGGKVPSGGGILAMASWQVQQRWMNELLADRSSPPDVDRPRNAPPRPRSEHVRMVTV